MPQPIRRLLGREPPLGTLSIIDDVSGIIHPGVLTLLLGPPGSGKTTLLKTLAGYNRREQGIKVRVGCTLAGFRCFFGGACMKLAVVPAAVDRLLLHVVHAAQPRFSLHARTRRSRRRS